VANGDGAVTHDELARQRSRSTSRRPASGQREGIRLVRDTGPGGGCGEAPFDSPCFTRRACARAGGRRRR